MTLASDDEDIGANQPSEHRLNPLSHEVTTIEDERGHPFAAMLSDGQLVHATPSRVGQVAAVGQVHFVQPALNEAVLYCETVWDGAAPDRYGGFTKGEMLGDYAMTGALYKGEGGPVFKVQSKAWSQRMRAMERKAELEDWFENRITAVNED